MTGYAKIKEVGGGQAMTTATLTAMTWDTAVADTGDFWDSGDPDVGANGFSIPSGVTKVEITAQISVASVASGKIINIRVLKNGTDIVMFNILAAVGTGTLHLLGSSGIIDVVAGDYFEVHGYHNSGATKQGNAFTYGNFFEIIDRNEFV